MRNPSPSLQQLNRTFIGSVLFIDIVGYSRRTVPDQLAIKEVFNALLTEAVQTVAPAERIMVDTGDGAAVAFLGDPEDALFAALSLRDVIDAGKITIGEPGFVRMGINLGPLKMVRDINGHTNMIGDGVNDAQRVMSFAEPGQVMVSHSYFDIISRFSRDYTKLFVYEGTRHDKHVREHEVYRFGPTEGAEELAEKMRDRSRARQPGGTDQAWVDNGGLHVPYANAMPLPGRAGKYAAAPGKHARQWAWPATAAVAVLAGAVWSWTGIPVMKKPDTSVASAAAASSPPQAVPPTGQQTGTSTTASAPAGTETGPEKTMEKAAGKTADKTAEKSANSPDNAAPAVKPGTLKLAIQPWGEIYVDGRKRGVSPPLKSLNLAPGRYRIEIRNAQFEPYKQTVEVKSEAETMVQYVF